MTEPVDPIDNVVHIRFKRTKEDLPTPPVQKARPGAHRPYCGTHLFEYDMDERSVSCLKCGRKFDAFEALDHLGREWAAYDFNHRNVRGEIADLHKQRDKVAKQVTNLKAQRRRLVPNVRQDVERVRSELWRHGHEKNPEIKDAIWRTVQGRIEKILRTLDAFGDEESTKRAVGATQPNSNGSNDG